MKTVYVVAGNKREFEYFKRESRKEWDKFVFVSGRDSLRGVRNADVRFYGTFYMRLDLSAIEEEVRMKAAAGDLK